MARQRQGSVATSVRESGQNCQRQSFKVSGPANVDVAYARAKSRHGWRTAEEATDGAYLFPDDDFKHVVTPGAFYDLWDYPTFRTGRGVEETVFMRVTLMKAPRGTDLEANYCLDPGQLYANAEVKAQLRQIVQ